MKKYLNAILVAGSVLACSVASQAATVTLDAADAFGETSFNTGLHWSDANVPSSGNDYVVDGGAIRLRTPADGGNYTFGGDSLTIVNSGADNSTYGLTYKGTGSSGILTINNLILDTGGQINALNASTDVCKLDGSISIAGDCSIYPKQGPINLLAPISGSATITNPGADSSACILSFMSASNTFTGNIVNNGRFALADGAVMDFVIGANGVNNSVSGTGASTTFNGVFVFDLSGAGTTIGNSWTIADVTNQSFGATFSVSNSTGASVVENANDSWYLDDAAGSGGKFIFHEDTGVLEVVSGNAFPVTAGNITPADGAFVTDLHDEISITLYDGMPNTVNTGTISMKLNGISVTPTVTMTGSGTNVVSYTPTFISGSNHVEVIFQDSAAQFFTNNWSITYSKAPADSAVKLWNVNFAGLSGGTLRNVTDGSVVRAPSTGSDLWYNAAATNQTDPAASNNSVTNTFDSVTDATGGNAIQFETRGSQRWGENIENNITVELFQGWAGANAYCNYDSELSGLDTNATYDLYVYSTWRWNENDTVYSLVEGSATITNAVITHNQSNIQSDAATDYNDLVEGENYYVFTSITPTADGRIVFHVGDGADTVCNGFQLVQRPADGPGFAPVITSISIAAGTVTINWDSDTLGTYQIESKSSLTSPTWSPVAGATGLTGGAGQSTAFSVSGDPAEFFQIKGE